MAHKQRGERSVREACGRVTGCPVRSCGARTLALGRVSGALMRDVQATRWNGPAAPHREAVRPTGVRTAIGFRTAYLARSPLQSWGPSVGRSAGSARCFAAASVRA